MRTILVTGATGFVGANLVRRLVSLDQNVHITQRENANLWRIKDVLYALTAHQVDLNDAVAVDKLISAIKPDIIFHLAAYAAYPFQRDINLTVNTNLLSTIHLLHACMKHGFECFINTGSSSEYGYKSQPMQETDRLEPNSLYAVTKSAATLYCEHIGKTHGLPIATLRLFSVYGPYEEPSRLVPTVVKACLTGEDPKLSSGSPVRDYIFIDDVVDLYLRLADAKELTGIVLNAGTGVQHSVAEVVAKCARITGSAIVPQWGSLPGRPWDTNTWVADISRIKDFLAWEPRFDLDGGLYETIRWFREYPQFI